MTDYLVVRDAPQMSRSDSCEIPRSAPGQMASVHRQTTPKEAPDSATTPGTETSPVGKTVTHTYPQEFSGDGDETDTEAEAHHPVRAVSHAHN